MEATLDAVRRASRGRNEAVRLRQSGQIPAVVYGGASDAEAIAVDPKSLMRILHSDSGANTLIALNLEGADTKVLVKEYQLHPVTHSLLHADFYRIAMDKVLQVTVPIRLTGEAKGVKAQGGVVDWVHRELEIECLPGDIPEHITVDITELMLHQGVRVRDLDTGGKWTALSEPEMLIVHVVAPRVEAAPATDEAAAAAAAAPGATAAEPEVIKKGKAEKDEEDKA
ncbi:MAG: 50S ribosomal protein L25 [Vicinamibacterales bacterium]